MRVTMWTLVAPKLPPPSFLAYLERAVVGTALAGLEVRNGVTVSP